MTGRSMTEADWLGSDDPGRLVAEARGWPSASGQPAARKFRLFACACCRHLWAGLTEASGRKAVEAAERFADGAATPRAMQSAWRAAYQAGRKGYTVRGDLLAQDCAWHDAEGAAVGAVQAAAEPTSGLSPSEAAALVREVFGNPYRPATLSEGSRTAAVLSLAQAAYEERELPSGLLDPARLAVLSDALEEAGCDDAGILTHLRSAGTHVRGCWALDLVLGKG